MHHRVARVSRGIKDFEVRTPPKRFVGKYASVDVGHDNIGEKQQDFRMGVEQTKRRVRAIGLDHIITELGQGIDAELAHGRLILDDEDHRLTGTSP